MSAVSLLWIALGGALGAVLRALATWAVPAGRLPWATLLVNVVGSFLIGWVIARPGITAHWSSHGYAFMVVGICGGFTTFSSFSWQTFELLETGHWFEAGLNIVLSVILCLLATWLGWRLGR